MENFVSKENKLNLYLNKIVILIIFLPWILYVL